PYRGPGRKDAYYAGELDRVRRGRRGRPLLLGDTNTGLPGIDEEAPAFGPKEAACLETLGRPGWLDAFRLLRGPARAYTWYSPNKGNGFRIDQAFLNQELVPRLRDVRYDWGSRARPRGATPSDHAALLLDLRG